MPDPTPPETAAAPAPAWAAAASGLSEAYRNPPPPPPRPPAQGAAPGTAQETLPGAARPAPASAPGFDPQPGPFPIPEADRRRRNGLFEVGVCMADGQVWYLPKPRVRLTAADNEDGYSATLSLKGADGFQALTRGLSDAEAMAPGPDRGLSMIRAELAIGRALVARNYELTTEELATVLQFGDDPEDDPEGVALREAVLNLAFGIAPKRSGGTAG